MNWGKLNRVASKDSGTRRRGFLSPGYHKVILSLILEEEAREQQTEGDGGRRKKRGRGRERKKKSNSLAFS